MKMMRTGYEHIEYTPYGELWVEETAAGLDSLPFRFTGKEYDDETGLYYYGARYLDPKYSRWLSGDPALGEYIPQAPVDDEARKHNQNLPRQGGVFNTVNLHLYHYAGNNPVKYTDPDGRVLKIAGNHTYRMKLQNVLQKLDPNARVHVRTGVVSTSSTGNSVASQLIQRLVSSKHTVTVQFESGKHDSKPDSWVNAVKMGKGTNTTIRFDKKYTQLRRYFQKSKEGNISETNATPIEIVFAHELIHGLHYAEGTGNNSHDSYTYKNEGWVNGKYRSGNSIIKGGLMYVAYPREEARTVGLGEYANEKITENAIRQELGYNERISY